MRILDFFPGYDMEDKVLIEGTKRMKFKKGYFGDIILFRLLVYLMRIKSQLL